MNILIRILLTAVLVMVIAHFMPGIALQGYGRRLLGLQFNASPKITSPLNLPAPGRCQALYFILRFCRALCF